MRGGTGGLIKSGVVGCIAGCESVTGISISCVTRGSTAAGGGTTAYMSISLGELGRALVIAASAGDIL